MSNPNCKPTSTPIYGWLARWKCFDSSANTFRVFCYFAKQTLITKDFASGEIFALHSIFNFCSKMKIHRDRKSPQLRGRVNELVKSNLHNIISSYNRKSIRLSVQRPISFLNNNNHIFSGFPFLVLSPWNILKCINLSFFLITFNKYFTQDDIDVSPPTIPCQKFKEFESFLMSPVALIVNSAPR